MEPTQAVKLHLIVTKLRVTRHSICSLLSNDFAYWGGGWRGYLQTLTLFMVCLPSAGKMTIFDRLRLDQGE